MGINLHFMGAAEGVTGSRYLLDVDGCRILIDCGLFQGRRDEARARNLAMPCDGFSIDAVLLTHAHIDHSGALPTLMTCGFNGPIHCTPATADLAKILLRDSARIQEHDADYLNRQIRVKARESGRRVDPDELIHPLYSLEDAEKCDAHFRPLPYREKREIAPGITISFSDQGHIIGSAAILVEVRRNGDVFRIVFGGDRGRRGMPILRDPEEYPLCDVLLTESTYGDREHEPITSLKENLAEVITNAIRKRGRVIIPAFSVGRTQNILYHFAELRREKRLPPVEVYVDSPLSTQATHVYASHPECFDRQMAAFLKDEVNPFHFPGLSYIESVDESKALNDRNEPMIILSASGMCESGRVLHHLKHALPHPKNTVLLVGFMAENTLGRKLKEGAPVVRIYDQMVETRASILSLPGFSAHADRNDLLDSVRHLRDRGTLLCLVHGENGATRAFRDALIAEGHQRVHIARRMERITLV